MTQQQQQQQQQQLWPSCLQRDFQHRQAASGLDAAAERLLFLCEQVKHMCQALSSSTAAAGDAQP
jgi:hypothetical protein